MIVCELPDIVQPLFQHKSYNDFINVDINPFLEYDGAMEEFISSHTREMDKQFELDIERVIKDKDGNSIKFTPEESSSSTEYLKSNPFPSQFSESNQGPTFTTNTNHL
ncbi:hypothetical protein CYY_002583 [Polysphondylium violaceum]|uniref:Uncharacterized protein n=1 Tax=Polysphondylium violaceum TaxID=133409 RepID=A0A8J4Q7R7_9MYCE|nr:hypothetical protein CYY_002583 [Polysphondylium violaceum]